MQAMRKISFGTLLVWMFFFLACGKPEKEFTFWVGGAPEEINYWETLIDDFKKESGYDIRLVRQPTYSDQRKQGLAISLEAKQPNPDVFLMDVIWIKQFIESDWLEPLDPYIQSHSFSTEPFFEKILNSVDKANDTLYALPVFLDIGLLYYRTDLLEENGFSGPPKTWNELREYAEQIQKSQRQKTANFHGYVWQGAQYEGLVCNFLEFTASNGGGILRNDRIDLTQPENAEALQFMHDLIHKYRISPLNIYTEMKEEEVRRAFQRGNALFERNWLYAWNLHQSEGSQVKGKVGMAPLPHFEDGELASALGGWHIGISPYSDVKDQAWELVQFILSYESQKKLVLHLGWYPGRKDIYQDEEVAAKLHDVELLQKIFEHAVPRPNLAYYTEVSEIIQRYANNCLADKVSAEKALQQMQEEIEHIIKIYEK